MFTFLFISLLCGGSNPTPPQKAFQPAQPVAASGICYDVTDAQYLPVRVTAKVGGQEIDLGGSNKEGLVHLRVPPSTASLTFTSRGYHTVTIPVTVLGRPSPNATFAFAIYMSKTDSAKVQQMNQLVVSFRLPDDLIATYAVAPVNKESRAKFVRTPHGNIRPSGWSYENRNERFHSGMFIEGAQIGPYKALVTAAEGQVLVDETFPVKQGITLKEIVPTVSMETRTSAHRSGVTAAEPPAPRTLFFEQSQYELTPSTTTALDSMTQRLATDPTLIAEITGYTDNVGERKLNLTLSEYRARRVANYLRQKGVPESQLLVDWKGPDATLAPDETEEARRRSRRVVVRFLRK